MSELVIREVCMVSLQKKTALLIVLKHGAGYNWSLDVLSVCTIPVYFYLTFFRSIFFLLFWALLHVSVFGHSGADPRPFNYRKEGCGSWHPHPWMPRRKQVSINLALWSIFFVVLESLTMVCWLLNRYIVGADAVHHLYLGGFCIACVYLHFAR